MRPKAVPSTSATSCITGGSAQPEVVQQLGRQNPASHETQRRDEARPFEIREAEDAVSTRAALAEPRAESDEESADKHPREFGGWSQRQPLIEHSSGPRRLPS